MTAVAIEVLASALPDHDITLTPRPDGKFLLTVAKGGATQLCRAIDPRTVVDQSELRALAHELERDQKLVSGETDKACSMADAMKSYPGFLYGEFEALTPAQFYELVFGYYPKIYDEPFMEQMKELFN